MPATASGVYPCYENQFKIDNKTIADMESFSVSIDNGVEEWTPFEGEGWIRRLMTAKSMTISVSGKRNVGDDGNEYAVFNLEDKQTIVTAQALHSQMQLSA